MTWRIICDSTELAVECLQAAGEIGVSCAPEVNASEPVVEAARVPPAKVALALTLPPRLPQLVELAHAARAAGATCPIAIVDDGSAASMSRAAAFDLGLPGVREVRPLMAVLALLDSAVEAPWTASLRGLPEIDRIRLRRSMPAGSPRGTGQLARGEAGRIIMRAADGAEHVLGHGRDVAEALAALSSRDDGSPRVESSVDGVDARAVVDVLFGPRRALSDPASKSALIPYGIPVPDEELCASASRAAAEAARLGYPVRISLASPDLRIWDHPDLAVDMVDNAARVRDTFRQLLALAKLRMPEGVEEPEQRILGVMVTATSPAAALLRVHAYSLPRGRVAMELGFADPHGTASDDATCAVLPATADSIERALSRLRGSSLLFGGGAARRRAHREALAEVLLRLSAFVNERRAEVESVELRPIALLLDGSVEVREACVSVSDAFERSLNAGSALP